MYIEIENDRLISNDFGNPPKDSLETSAWYTQDQDAYLFNAYSRFPQKFMLRLSFESTLAKHNSVKAFSAGKYFIAEDSFYFDERNRNKPSIDLSKLELATPESIDVRIKELQDLKAEINKK